MTMNTIPAPLPSVNAWTTKPISYAAATVTRSSLQQMVDNKYDKGDQHDSGIDVSDQPNSAGSSTRSSPSAENKLRSEKVTRPKVMECPNYLVPSFLLIYFPLIECQCL